MLGGDYPVLATRIYQSLNAEPDVVGAVVLAVALTRMVLLVRLTAGIDRELPPVRVTPGALPAGRCPGRLDRVAVTGTVVAAVLMVVPLVVGVVAAFARVDGPGLTGAHIAEVFTRTHARALVTTVFLGLLATPLATALALAADRRTPRGGRRPHRSCGAALCPRHRPA